MKLRNLDLLTLLISLFTLGSCNNPEGIGLDVEPDILLNSSIVDTSTVLTKLIKEDSVLSNGIDRSVLAYIKDNEFGETSSDIAFALNLPKANVSFGDDPIIDSAVLVMSYSGTVPLYGDSARYKVNIKQLDEVYYNPTKPESYYTNKKWNYKNTVVGTRDFYPAYRDSINIKLYGAKKDSTIKVKAQLRIPMDKQFIIDNIVKLDSAQLSTTQKFTEAFKGLYMSLDKNTAPANGGAISFDTYNDGASRLEIYYRYTDHESLKKDTTIIAFAISGNVGGAATAVNWNNTGTPALATLQNNSNNHEKLYLKGLAGTKIKVEIPYVTELKKLGKNITINRAELVFTAEQPQQSSLKPLSQLRIYRWDLAHQPQYIPDESPSDPRNLGPNFVGGFYNTIKKTYIINITGYVQDLVKGRYPNYGTYINTFDFMTKAGALNAPGRSVLLGGASTSPDKVKLRVYYSDLK